MKIDSVSLEKNTVEKMISLFCRRMHNREEKCPSCMALIYYTHLRLDKCPYGPTKSVCSSCAKTCYLPEMQERFSEVIRFSGPRLVLHHPILAAAQMKKKITNISHRQGV
jgi:hypothetical protein